ncbi:hypothetical protein OH76DRAFT_1395175 [Lentinus brumalis]|uniref:Uncharacterized protein n=1 Tax=Lentinus brumalis TaxID=2498619 RepID=A0A371DXU6_9APHY|nr:hypothetical protein OH76DRAFT_1395175 [Polyporus brumalis]
MPSLATPPPSHPPSPMRAHADLPLPFNTPSCPPPYTPSPHSDSSWDNDLEKGKGLHESQPPSAAVMDTATSNPDRPAAKLHPQHRLVVLVQCLIPLTSLYTALSFPFGTSSALLGTHILSWQWPAYADILAWRFAFLPVLCGCALVACFFAVLTILAPSPDEPAEPASEARRFAGMVGFGAFVGLWAFAVGALALRDAPLDIPASFTPARALAANATGLVVIGCVAFAYRAMCAHLSRVRTTATVAS